MKKIFAIAFAFIFLLAGCQNDLPSGGDTFSGFEGYTQELSDSMLSVLPENGIILDKYEIEYEDGATVFEVFADVVKENKIHMEHTGTAKVPYIEGVANLYEFDCGPLSGWMYQVNGWFPSFSMGQYAVERGDSIEIIYTCDLGEDVGDTYGD